NDIDFEIVPGVTSAISAPAYAGIPLTHRSANSTLALVTGHEDPTKENSSINWESLAKGIGTIVFLMGVKNLPNRRVLHRLQSLSKSHPWIPHISENDRRLPPAAETLC
ncbi:MAG: hypothetical protein EOM18_16225, partial [Clostridia bacterium]|nr:hypothetical protein [Clostridia bacterium]